LTDMVLKYEPTSERDLNTAIEAAKTDRIEILKAQNNLVLQQIETHSVKSYYTPNLAIYKRAVNNLEDSKLAVPNSYKEVELDVRKCYQTFVESENSLLNMDKTLDLAEESERVTEIMFNNGLATVLDVLKANTTLKEAQTGRYNALVEYNINKMIFENINIISSSN